MNDVDALLRRAAADLRREADLRPLPPAPRAIRPRAPLGVAAMVAALAGVPVAATAIVVAALAVDDGPTTLATERPPSSSPPAGAVAGQPPAPPPTGATAGPPVPPGQPPSPVLRPTGERLPRAYRPATPPAGLSPDLEVRREVGVAPPPGGAALPTDPGPLGPVTAVQYGGIGGGRSLVVASVASRQLGDVLGNFATEPAKVVTAGGRRATLHEPQLPDDRRLLTWDDGQGVAVVVVATADVGPEALAEVLAGLRPGDPGPTLPPGGEPRPGGGSVIGGSYRLDGSPIGDGTSTPWGPASMSLLGDVLGHVGLSEVVDGHRWTVATALDDFGGYFLSESYGGQPLSSVLADVHNVSPPLGQTVYGYGAGERSGRLLLSGAVRPDVARVRFELAGGGEISVPTHPVRTPVPMRYYLATAPLGTEVEALVALGAGGEELQRVEDPNRPPVPPPGGGG